MTDIRYIVRSEWLKLWSVRSTWWCLGATAVVVPLFGALAEDGFDPLEPLAAVLVAQFVFGVLGVLTATSEYSTGQIHSSLLAVPRPRRLLAVKLAVLTAVVAAVASVLTFGTFFLAQALYPDGLGIGPAEGGAWKALLGSIAYLLFITVFGFAVGAAVRGTGAGITLFTAVAFVAMSALPAVFPGVLRDQAVRYTFIGLAESLTTLQPDPRPGMPAAALLLAAYAALTLAPVMLLAERRDN